MTSWAKKRDVMHRYDLTAHMYDERYAVEQAAKIKTALKDVTMKVHDLVLDVGCGTGILFDFVADKTKATLGLDISKRSLLRAKERVKNSCNAHLVLADADNIPVKSRIFNRVFAMTVLQNTPEPHSTLEEIERTATDDAVIVVTGLKKVLAKNALKHLLTNAGLKIVKLHGEGLKCNVAICTKMDLVHSSEM